ncbi:phosphatase PAP2 family protein [Pseudoxanthomonas sp. NC8]|nr:phosphatase PAP2 family protein [Pseudoxanthomonas sp. NC8]
MVWPLLAAVLASAVLMHGGDRWLADLLFHLEGGRWALRNHWLTSGLIHGGGRIASTLAWLAVLGLYLRALRRADQASLRRPLLYLLVAVALGAGAVSALKSITHVDCPWDLVGYGGARTPLKMFAPLPAGARAGACYPAGHASAGYAWVALYFAALRWWPRWRWHGLAIGLAAGLLFGIGQQLRGAHFLSHDVATLAVCWLVSLGLFHMPAAGAARAIGSTRAA